MSLKPVATLVLLAVLVACGGPALVLPEKTTPAVTRIALAVQIDPALVRAAQQQMQAAANPAPAPAADEGAFGERLYQSAERAAREAEARVAESLESMDGQSAQRTSKRAAAPEAPNAADPTGVWAPNLVARLRAGLLDRKIGIPTGEDAADLKLQGTLRQSPSAGVDLDWVLVEPKSQTTVASGVASDTWFTGDADHLSKQVFAKLLATDVDRWASNAVPTPPPSPSPVPVGPPDATTDGKDAYALVIGIEKYRDALPVATHAEADARAFAAYAQKTLGVPEAHTRLLVGERASLADIASAVEEWLPRNARKPGGRVYVFFSGHGAPDPETGRAYLVPYDADPAYLKTRGYAVGRLHEALGKLEGQQSVLFMDACFSGSGTRSVLAAGTRPLVPVQADVPKSGLVAFAAAGARETTGAARGAPHGLFTHHLLAALGGAADRDGNRDVSLAEVAAYVTQRVSADARLDNREQTPTLHVPAGLVAERFPLVTGLAP